MEGNLFDAFEEDDDLRIKDKELLKKKRREREDNTVSKSSDRLGNKKPKIK